MTQKWQGISLRAVHLLWACWHLCLSSSFTDTLSVTGALSLPLAVLTSTFSSPHCSHSTESTKKGGGPILIFLTSHWGTNKIVFLPGLSSSVFTEIRNVPEEISTEKVFCLQIFLQVHFFFKFYRIKEGKIQVSELTAQKPLLLKLYFMSDNFVHTLFIGVCNLYSLTQQYRRKKRHQFDKMELLKMNVFSMSVIFYFYLS